MDGRPAERARRKRLSKQNPHPLPDYRDISSDCPTRYQADLPVTCANAMRGARVACGNNSVGREQLSSPPTSVAQKLGARAINPAARFAAPAVMPAERVSVLVTESGHASKKVGPRHVHVVYNLDSKDAGPPTGVVMVQVTDRTQPTAADHLHHTPSNPRQGGHHEVTLFLRPQSPERIEAEVQRARDILKSRAPGDR